MDDFDPIIAPTPDGEPPSRSDLKLWQQALRNDWAIPPAVKRRLLQVAVNLADPDDDEPIPSWSPDAKIPESYTLGQRVRIASVRDRTKLGALRVVGLFAALNVRQAALDLARERFEREKAEADGGAGDMTEVHERMAAYRDPDATTS